MSQEDVDSKISSSEEKSFFIFYSDTNGLKKRLYVSKNYKVSLIINLLSSNNSKEKEYNLLSNGKIVELEKTFKENGINKGDYIVIHDKTNE